KLLLFHNHVAFELFQSLERHFQRMPVETAGLGVVVRGAGWQVAYCYGKPFKQPLSQRPHLGVEREPVQNPFPYRARLRHCHDALIKGGSATLKTYPQELPLSVGRQQNSKRGRFATPSGGESSPRFTASSFRLRLCEQSLNVPAAMHHLQYQFAIVKRTER